MIMSVKNIIIAGVGGQGTLLASKLMGKVFTDLGYDVKVSEVHGMSQRGGSVVTYVRFGDKVWSSLIEEGEADIVLSFEQLEMARWLTYLKPDGVMITSTQKIDPMSVITGNAVYPEGVIESVKALGVKVVDVDALALAEEAGSARCVNLVLLGVCAKFLHIEKGVWESAIRETVPAKTIDMNINAFNFGYSAE